jgi:hypothetical protein
LDPDLKFEAPENKKVKQLSKAYTARHTEWKQLAPSRNLANAKVINKSNQYLLLQPIQSMAFRGKKLKMLVFCGRTDSTVLGIRAG